MAYFYVVYKYVISEWRSIRPVVINQYDITMATHYDITMGNDVARDAHCEIVVFSLVSKWDEKLVVWNKNKNKFIFNQSRLENTFVVFV